MPPAKSSTATMASISETRAKLQAQLAGLAREEKRLLDIERDRGRTVLMTALERVKIAEMDREDAKAIATAIGTLPAAEIVAALARVSGEKSTA